MHKQNAPFAFAAWLNLLTAKSYLRAERYANTLYETEATPCGIIMHLFPFCVSKVHARAVILSYRV